MSDDDPRISPEDAMKGMFPDASPSELRRMIDGIRDEEALNVEHGRSRAGGLEIDTRQSTVTGNPHITLEELARVAYLGDLDRDRYRHLYEGAWPEEHDPNDPQGEEPLLVHEQHGELRWRLGKYVQSIRAQIAAYDGPTHDNEGNVISPQLPMFLIAESLDAILKGTT